jgi:hypothetical protein
MTSGSSIRLGLHASFAKNDCVEEPKYFKFPFQTFDGRFLFETRSVHELPGTNIAVGPVAKKLTMASLTKNKQQEKT